jgi:Leucine-rich repeat (LRR) protein
MTPEELDKFLTETTKSNKSLETLDLSRKELTELSPKIKNFQHLVVLNLYDNKLLSLPNEIGDLKNLRELGLSENRLTTLPKTIGNLVNLLTLDLRFNKYGRIVCSSSLPAACVAMFWNRSTIVAFLIRDAGWCRSPTRSAN